MKITWHKTIFFGMMALTLFLSHEVLGQSCGFNGGELLVRVPNILPHPIEYTVKMVAKVPEEDIEDAPTFVQVWDSTGYQVFPPHPFYEVSFTKIVDTSSTGCFTFEWVALGIDSNNPVFGSSYYAVQLWQDTTILASTDIEYRCCPPTLGSPDVILVYSPYSGRLNKTDQTGGSDTGSTVSGYITPPNTFPPTCLSLPITVRNDFHLSSQIYSDKSLVINDSCAATIASGGTVEFFGAPTVKIHPTYNKYNDMQYDSGVVYRFAYWKDDKSDYDINTFSNLTKPRIVNSNFLQSYSVKTSIKYDNNNAAGSMLFQDPWFVVQDTSSCSLTSQSDAFHVISVPESGFNFGQFSYGGVFLNQGNPIDLHPPYYSLRASKFLDTSGTHKWPGTPLEAGESVFTAFSVAPRDTSAFVVTDPLDTAAQYVIAIDSHIPFLYVPARSRSNQ